MSEVRGVKITLQSGKEILFRDYKIKHRELAIRAVGNKSGDSQYLFGELLQKEMLKILLYQIDGAKLAPHEVEDLDAIFSPDEYNELSFVIGKVMGGSMQMGEPKIEFVSIGG